MSGTGITLEKVIGFALAFAVIIIIFMSIPTLRDTAGTLLSWGFGNNTAKTLEGINPYNTFIYQYRLCKSLPDDDCLCPISLFSLPKTGYIEMENNGGLTSFNYYEGSVKSATEVNGNLIAGCKNQSGNSCIASSPYVVSGDSIYIPSSAPGVFSYDISDGKLGLSGYTTDSKVYLTYFEPSRFSTETNSEYATPVEVFTSRDINGYNQFNLQGIYKKGNFLYMVPTTNSQLPFIRRMNDNTNMKDYKTLYTCKTPRNIESTINIVDGLKQALDSCSGKGNVMNPVKCSSVTLAPPQDYSVELSESGVILNYKGKPVYSFSMLLFNLEDPTKSTRLPLQKITIDSSSSKRVDIYNCPGNILCLNFQVNTQPVNPASIQNIAAQTLKK